MAETQTSYFINALNILEHVLTMYHIYYSVVSMTTVAPSLPIISRHQLRTRYRTEESPQECDHGLSKHGFLPGPSRHVSQPQA